MTGNFACRLLWHSPAHQSQESKRGRGGKRPGAGRKPNLAKRLLKGFTRETIAQAAADIDVGAVIVGLLKARSERTRLESLSDVGIQLLDSVTKEISGASQDGSHNQIESKPAIEAEVLSSDA